MTCPSPAETEIRRVGHAALAGSDLPRWPLFEALVLGALVLTSCRCGNPVVPARAELRVTPSRLDFGRVALGASLQLDLELVNAGTAPTNFSANVLAPFHVGPNDTALGGGEARTLGVRFTPEAVGAAQGVVTITWADQARSVELSGEGVPACAASSQCLDVVFDLESRTCLEQPSPRRPCTECVEDGFCESGVCVGTRSRCDDHDPCTDDACSLATGCLFTPTQCPVVDACRVAFCAPDAGCGSVEVEDGTPCGAADCLTAHICLGGACVLRQRPNAAANCTYQAVAASGSTMCALTTAGGLKCWGSAGPRSVNAPHLLATQGFVSLHGGTRALCAIDAAGTPLCVRGGPDGGLGGPVRALSAVSPLAVLASGEAQRWNWWTGAVDAPISLDDAGVLAVASDALWVTSQPLPEDLTCWLNRDGGVECDQLDLSSLQLPAASALRQLEVRLMCAQTAGGPRCWHTKPQLSVALVDGGVDDIVGSRGTSGLVHDQLCVASGTSLACGASNFFASLAATFPVAVRQLTSGSESLCALTDSADIYCLGTNSSGELGDDSVLPMGVVELSLPGGANTIAVTPGGTAAANDAGIWFWGGGDPVPRLAWAGDARGGLGFTSQGGLCARETTGTVSCWHADAGPSFVVGNTVRLDPSWEGSCAVLDGGAVRSLPSGAAWMLTSIQQVAGSCALTSRGQVLCTSASSPNPLDRCSAEVDGGYACNGWPLEPVVLPAPAVSLSHSSLVFQYPLGEGCAILATGDVWCWAGANSAAIQIPGLVFPRLVVGDVSAGCALSGLNGVQCWGTNRYGILANSMASSATPVWVPMPEPTRSLVQVPSGHTCALLASGQLRCWGANQSSELGVASRVESSTPVKVSR
jgi:hypothetical protein